MIVIYEFLLVGLYSPLNFHATMAVSAHNRDNYCLTLLSSNIHYRYFPTKIAIILFKILLYESHNITLWFSQKFIRSWKSSNMIMPHCTKIIWPNCVIQVSTYLSNKMYLNHIKYYSPLDLPIPPSIPHYPPAPSIFLTFDSNQSPTHTGI